MSIQKKTIDKDGHSRWLETGYDDGDHLRLETDKKDKDVVMEEWGIIEHDNMDKN